MRTGKPSAWVPSGGEPRCCSNSMTESNFLPMSQAMERCDAVLSHRELL
jgi:hypothetical protein